MKDEMKTSLRRCDRVTGLSSERSGFCSSFIFLRDDLLLWTSLNCYILETKVSTKSLKYITILSKNWRNNYAESLIISLTIEYMFFLSFCSVCEKLPMEWEKTQLYVGSRQDFTARKTMHIYMYVYLNGRKLKLDSAKMQSWKVEMENYDLPICCFKVRNNK